MSLLSQLFMAVSLAISLASPISASAATGLSFGGRIVSVIPCIAPTGPAVQISIVPAGVTSAALFYIWSFGTIGLPPTHPGQFILGVADTLYGCKAGVVPLVGLRIQRDGVSI